MSLPRRLTAALAVLAASMLVVGGFAAPAEAAKAKPKVYKEYVSLGDSWTADVVLLNLQGLPATEFAPIDCAQSRVNYPRLVAKSLKVTTFRDASCGSATTQHFSKPQSGLPIGGTNPPQFDRLTKTTDLVTVGIGGNDAGIASAATGCLNLLPNLGLGLPSPLGGSCKEKLTAGGKDQLSAQVKASEPKVVAALRAIRKKSPKARILLVNYLAAVPKTGCYPYVQADNADVAYLYVKFNELNAMLKRAAKTASVELVDTYKPTIGHDVCQLPWVRYVEGVIPLSLNAPALSIPLHPNSAGAEAQAKAVLAQISK